MTTHISTISQETIHKLLDLGAATIYEAQGAFGALSSQLKPIDGTMKLAGPAFTVDMRPGDNLMIHYALLKAKPGDILVLDAKGFIEAGVWGDVLTEQAMKLGLGGLVVNGAVRDASAIIAHGFPVFCKGLSIKGTGKNQPGKINEPIIIDDVVINAGDIIVGDRDGLVVIPRANLNVAITQSIAREQKEAMFKEKLREGGNTAELLNLTETLTRLQLI
ncbi:RraA family protein [Conservatibacter flavescens]|uniref:Putative 4-hydroxy-4-methyl-2-oxoglutarate aldolase n=1 Tax=Conservatibacter flavescens TaxID=28161 RepID=A0A2M8S1D5_9PAST|nr:4-hydroxy-4-methyl-2-oxoglutarate aldolase [Conservatibacter flavescens]PJG84950.1 4-hydroxy-4-methyl-2-oxoglutarate aldolase [Conservatibacter flavescens]